MSNRKVVVTGAAGYVAGRMLPALRERYDLTLLDVRTTDREGSAVPGVQTADLIAPDRNAYRDHFRGADAVIHCGFTRPANRDASPEDHYRAEVDNINMAFNVYQTSLEEGVRRVVVCSSNHAADYYERLIWADKCDVVTPDMRPLSDNYYGWAKEVYEHLGFVFATGHVGGKRLQNVQIRIGGPRETDLARSTGADLKRVHRALGAYLSVRDQVQLFVKSIETEHIEDENGVPFQIFYGISGNSHNFWSLVNARKVIGYEPQDNSQVRFADQLARILQEAQQRQGVKAMNEDRQPESASTAVTAGDITTAPAHPGTAPGRALRSARGLLWGLLFGQWWTLCSILSAFVWHRDMLESKPFYYLSTSLVYAICGSLAGLLIGLADATPAAGMAIGIGVGLAACLLEMLLDHDFSRPINLVFYYFTGRFVGLAITGRVRQPAPWKT